jgi:hypothetical protein
MTKRRFVVRLSSFVKTTKAGFQLKCTTVFRRWSRGAIRVYRSSRVRQALMTEHQLNFDPQLPDLQRVLDRDWVVRRFAEQWPSSGTAPRAVIAGRLQDTKYQPRKRCVATYQLQLDTTGGPTQTIGVVEATPAGVAHRLYSDDPQLPWLQAAADPAGMAARFAELLGPGSAAEIGCAITPVRYRAGARCVFRYDLAQGAERRTLFGKLMATGAEQLMATVSSLHEASERAPALPRILPPLAYWPDVGMLVQPEVSGRAELNDLGFDPAADAGDRARWLRAAGSCLAALHGLSGVAGPPRTLADDLAELEEYLAPMAIADPALADRYAALLAAIHARAGGAEPAPVASHGAFRTDQFMIEGERLVMIDLDGFCWSAPARDLGNYQAYLSWKRIRQPQRAALIDQASQLVEAGYQSLRELPEPGWLAIYTAGSLLKIAGRRFRSLTIKEWPLIPALLDTAAQALERA